MTHADDWLQRGFTYDRVTQAVECIRPALRRVLHKPNFASLVVLKATKEGSTEDVNTIDLIVLSTFVVIKMKQRHSDVLPACMSPLDELSFVANCIANLDLLKGYPLDWTCQDDSLSNGLPRYLEMLRELESGLDAWHLVTEPEFGEIETTPERT